MRKNYILMLMFIILLIILPSCSANNISNIKSNISQIDNAQVLSSSVVKENNDITLSLIAVGDNLIHNSIYLEANKRTGGKSYNFLPAYEPVADQIKKADISFINQETVLGGTKLGLSSYPLFNSPQELGNDLVSLGFDVVSQASNHTYDKGETGIKNTIEFWKTKPNVLLIGVNDGTLPNIQYLDKNNLKIAFLSYTYGTNGISLPKDSKYSVKTIDKTKISSDVQIAKQNADIVIVYMHWGDEYKMAANSEQKDISKMLASLNVDLIIGSHPHVIQPMESIKRSDGKEMVVAYSLGNFISAQNKAESMLGGMLSVKFKGKKSNIKIDEAKFIPLITHYEGGYKNIKVYPFNNYSSKLASYHGCKNYDKRFSYQFIDNLINKTIDKKYLY